MLSLPSSLEPYWRTSVALPSFSKLTEDIRTDVAIIGGGISGITTAYLLAKKGVRVTLLEADRLLNGTTGHTTAKITAQHDIIYDELINHFGQEKAKLYYEACMEALRFIRSTIEQEAIDCDFIEQDAYIYTDSSSSLTKLINEMEQRRPHMGLPLPRLAILHSRRCCRRTGEISFKQNRGRSIITKGCPIRRPFVASANYIIMLIECSYICALRDQCKAPFFFV